MRGTAHGPDGCPRTAYIRSWVLANPAQANLIPCADGRKRGSSDVGSPSTRLRTLLPVPGKSDGNAGNNISDTPADKQPEKEAPRQPQSMDVYSLKFLPGCSTHLKQGFRREDQSRRKLGRVPFLWKPQWQPKKREAEQIDRRGKPARHGLVRGALSCPGVRLS